jgi:hypothetical protein
MASKSYTQISGFWYAGVPAVILGLGYYLWHSQGFVSLLVREELTPLVDFVSRLFSGLV